VELDGSDKGVAGLLDDVITYLAAGAQGRTWEEQWDEIRVGGVGRETAVEGCETEQEGGNARDP
jgi:hypothetical protein